MRPTKGLLTRDEALALAPDYVRFIEDKDFDFLDKILPKFNELRKGQEVVTCNDGQFVRAKVTSVNSNDMRAVDGPVVRVGNGEYTWRVDGCDYAYPTE